MPQPLSYSLCDAMRRVLLGADLDAVRLSHRAAARLGVVRDDGRHLVNDTYTVVVRHDKDQVRWWTWAVGRAGAVLAAALSRVAPGMVDEVDRFDNCYLRLRGDVTVGALGDALAAARRMFGDDLAGVEPDVTQEAVRQLKFAELLPPDLAHDTLAARAADHDAAKQVLARRVIEHLV